MAITVNGLVMPNGEEYRFVGGGWCSNCYTSSTTRDKVVTIQGLDTATIINGERIVVYFDSAQSYNGQPRLYVNNSSLLDIYYADGTVVGLNAWKANELVTFIYRNLRWYMDKLPLPIWNGSVTP